MLIVTDFNITITNINITTPRNHLTCQKLLELELQDSGIPNTTSHSKGLMLVHVGLALASKGRVRRWGNILWLRAKISTGCCQHKTSTNPPRLDHEYQK